MKKWFVGLFVWIRVITLWADEGMWLPFLLDPDVYNEMRAKGLKLTPDEIYSINHGSLKDAIVIFGRGCTGHVVSPEGLIFTNHHCGYPSIAALSSYSNDILTHGYFAERLEDELYPPTNLSVRFLLRVEDVTKKILDSIPMNATEKERNEIIERISSRLIKEATKGEFQEAVIKDFYYGNEFYLFVYEIYPDVRLVLTPPASIGNFGGDTDNWMWPRHTGDFAVFRVYATPDGKPARFSKSNVPLKPRHYLPISISPRKEGDFTMVVGYPGTTLRYLTSYELKLFYHELNPLIVDARALKLKVMKNAMDADPRVRLKYIANYQMVINYYKYYQGQNLGIKRQRLIEERVGLEDDFESWADNDDIVKTDYYKSALVKVKASISRMVDLLKTQKLLYECFISSNSFFPLAAKFFKVEQILNQPKVNVTELDNTLKSLEKDITTYYKLFDFDTEKKLLAAMLQFYAERVPSIYKLSVYDEISLKFKNNYNLFADAAFTASIFGDSVKMKLFLKNPVKEVLNKDPLFQLAKNVYKINDEVKSYLAPLQDQKNVAMRSYIKGLREMQKDRKFYPDANSTMRLSYGTIMGYRPKDAVVYNYFTTIDGLMMKEDSNSEDFKVPEALKRLYEQRDFGRYGENGTLVVCFLTNNDITGGNSGSPVLNGKGELIGLAFDKNWEATTSDYLFLPDVQRSIVVDIRYVLFIMDKMMHAQRILNELDIRS